MKKHAFTLAEIMLVLTVIAILTAILLPSARNAMPNEKVMKFKKGHNALYSAISELVNSDKYYLDGDLGTKVDGTRLHSGNQTTTDEIILERRKYLCQTIGDVISAKSVNCVSEGSHGWIALRTNQSNISSLIAENGEEVSLEVLETRKKSFDSGCKKIILTTKPNQIITPDNIWFWDAAPVTALGAIQKIDGVIVRQFSPPSQHPATFYDKHGMDVVYKPFCMDIDGVPENATATDCVNECPFGYGIQADGKILNGARADEWLNKSIQEKD